MSPVNTRRLLQALSLLALVLSLGACGFHLRQNATLPPTVHRVHLSVSGGGDLQRSLARALQTSGASVEDASGPGIAELRVPVAAFSTETLSAGGYARITEYAVRYQVQFEVIGGDGQLFVPRQRIDMSREYSYDASNSVGNESQVREIQRSLNDDMVQAILFRLEAAGRHELAAPSHTTSTH
ncbi:MAG TPA: LPS assembly lipoprotein LptE [Rhodanobacter sp.]